MNKHCPYNGGGTMPLYTHIPANDENELKWWVDYLCFWNANLFMMRNVIWFLLQKTYSMIWNVILFFGYVNYEMWSLSGDFGNKLNMICEWIETQLREHYESNINDVYENLVCYDVLENIFIYVCWVVLNVLLGEILSVLI